MGPHTLAGPSVPAWPTDSLDLLLIAIALAIVACVVSGAVLARMSRSRQVRRLEAEIEAHATRRRQTAQPEPAPAHALRGADPETGRPREREQGARESKSQQSILTEPQVLSTTEEDA
jgi:hypothetical protein